MAESKMGRQQQFKFRTWGGRRAGSGRKPRGKSAGVAHAARPAFTRTLPVHVTLRFEKRVWNGDQYYPDARSYVWKSGLVSLGLFALILGCMVGMRLGM